MRRILFACFLVVARATGAAAGPREDADSALACFVVLGGTL